MTVVLVGLCVSMSGGDILNPSLFFLAFIASSFVLAGIIHPYEFFCLLHGILYFVCIPAGYLILMIYSLSNMHVVSWGTREVIASWLLSVTGIAIIGVNRCSMTVTGALSGIRLNTTIEILFVKFFTLEC